MPPLTRLVLFLLTQAPAPINIDFERYGSLGLLAYLVGEKLMPAILHIVRPRQERQMQREEEQAKRVRELEDREAARQEKLTQAFDRMSVTLSELSATMTGINQRVGNIESNTTTTRTDIATLMERTAACDIRTQPKGKQPRKETA